MRGRNLIVYFTIASFVTAPLAEAQQKVNWASQELKSYIKDNTKSGGKPITMKEFWEKNKKQLSPFWQQQLLQSVELQKDQPLPQMEVIDIKGPQGQNSARLQLNYNGRTVSVEYYGYKDKFARINGTTITFDEFYGVTGMMKKLMRDPMFANESKVLKEKALKAPVFPSYETFARMTARQRAEYFVNLRLLVEAANDVQKAAMKVSYNNDSESESPFIRFILEKAYAADKKKPARNTNDPRNWIGQECIIAGYVGKYVVEGGNTICSHTTAVSKLANTVVDYKQAQQKNVSKTVYDNSCGTGNFRCNPFIYGYERGHGSLCLPIGKTRDFQEATKTCDDRSPLTKKGNLVDNTRAMIETLLKQEGKNKDDFFKDGKLVSKEKYEELKNTVLADFNKFIDRGLDTCRGTGFLDPVKGLNDEGIGEVNQPGACEVLYNRKLAFKEGMDKLAEELKDKPTPAPVPTPGKEDGQPCDLEAPAKGKGTWKDGKCVPNTVPPAVDADPCNGLMKPTDIFNEHAENKKGGCGTPATAVADRLADGAGAKKAGTSFWDEWKGLLIPAGIFIGLFALFRHWWKAGSGPGVIPGTDPASPPLPAPPPQPGPVVPSPPIIPAPPPAVTPPGSSEGGTTPNNPSSGGQR